MPAVEYDNYDAMDGSLHHINNRIPRIVQMVTSLGFTVQSIANADYDTDGMIELEDGYHIQVGIDGILALNHSDDKGVTFGKPIKTLHELAGQLTIAFTTNREN